MEQQAVKGWYIENWGTWGWAETLIKLAALFVGIGAFFQSISASNVITTGNPQLAAIVLLGLLTLASLGLIFARLQQKEIVSFVFAIINVLGHAGVLITLLCLPDQTGLPIIFALFYIVGQVVKFAFLQSSGYAEQGQSTSGMIRFNWVITSFYVFFALILIL